MHTWLKQMMLSHEVQNRMASQRSRTAERIRFVSLGGFCMDEGEES